MSIQDVNYLLKEIVFDLDEIRGIIPSGDSLDFTIFIQEVR